MINYAIKRVAQIIPTMLVLSLLAFYAVNAMPAGPGGGISFTGTDPTHVRYVRYMAGVLQGDFGVSMRTGRPVAMDISMRFPYTLSLAFGGIFIAGLLGVLLGIICAVNHNKAIDNIIMTASLVTTSMPLFFIAVVLLLIFCLYLGLLPSRGMDSWKGYIMPVLTLGLPSVGFIARTVRSSMLEVIEQDYIRASIARGIPEKIVVYIHAFKNTLIPVMTAAGVRFGELLAGTVLVENAFSIPGLGRLITDSIVYRDYNMLLAAIITLASTFLIINIVIDLLYAVADPRVSHGKKAQSNNTN